MGVVAMMTLRMTAAGPKHDLNLLDVMNGSRTAKFRGPGSVAELSTTLGRALLAAHPDWFVEITSPAAKGRRTKVQTAAPHGKSPRAPEPEGTERCYVCLDEEGSADGTVDDC